MKGSKQLKEMAKLKSKSNKNGRHFKSSLPKRNIDALISAKWAQYIALMHKMGTLPNLTLKEKQVRRIRCARTFWALWVMQTMESGFISTAAILWKENIRRFCRSERTPNVVQKFGSFWFFLRNASLESGLFQLQSEHPQVLSTQISNQLESWIPSETFISKHVELHFKIVTVHK